MNGTPSHRPQLGDLHRRIMGDVKPFHSHSYAEVARGKRLGATTASPFSQRLRVERNRQAVRGYRDSMITQQQDVDRRSPSPSTRQPQSIQAPPRNTPNQGFKEPPTRGYNPYA